MLTSCYFRYTRWQLVGDSYLWRRNVEKQVSQYEPPNHMDLGVSEVSLIPKTHFSICMGMRLATCLYNIYIYTLEGLLRFDDRCTQYVTQLTNITACSLIPPPSAYSNTNLKLSISSSQSYFLLPCSHIYTCSLQFQEHKCEHDSTNKSRDKLRLAFPEWSSYSKPFSEVWKVPCKFKFSLYEICRMQLWPLYSCKGQYHYTL